MKNIKNNFAKKMWDNFVYTKQFYERKLYSSSFGRVIVFSFLFQELYFFFNFSILYKQNIQNSLMKSLNLSYCNKREK